MQPSARYWRNRRKRRPDGLFSKQQTARAQVMDSTPLNLKQNDFSPLPSYMVSGLFTLALHVLLFMGLYLLVQPPPAAIDAYIEVRLAFSAASPANSEQTENVIPESASPAPAKHREKTTPKAGPKKQTAATQKNSAPANSANPDGVKGKGSTSNPAQAQGGPAPLAGNPKPHYPELARKRGQEGLVLLRAEVNPQGEPVKVEIQKSSGYPLLDQSALKTVRKWRFQPPQENGESRPGNIVLPVEFKLRD